MKKNHGVPGSEIGREPTNSYLICISRKVLGQVNTSGTQTLKSENNIPSIINDLALSKFTDSKPLKWREGQIFPREDLAHWKFVLCIFLPAWPKRSVAFYQGWGNAKRSFGGYLLALKCFWFQEAKMSLGSPVRVGGLWSSCDQGVSAQVCLTVGPLCPPTTLWLSPVPGQVYSAVGRTLHWFSDLCSGDYYGRKTLWAKTHCPWTSVFRLYTGPSDSHGPISLCCMFSIDSSRLKTCVCLSYSQVLKNSGRYHLASIFSNSTEVSSASSPPPLRFHSVPRRQRRC